MNDPGVYDSYGYKWFPISVGDYDTTYGCAACGYRFTEQGDATRYENHAKAAHRCAVGLMASAPVPPRFKPHQVAEVLKWNPEAKDVQVQFNMAFKDLNPGDKLVVERAEPKSQEQPVVASSLIAGTPVWHRRKDGKWFHCTVVQPSFDDHLKRDQVCLHYDDGEFCGMQVFVADVNEIRLNDPNLEQAGSPK